MGPETVFLPAVAAATAAPAAAAAPRATLHSKGLYFHWKNQSSPILCNT